MQSVFAAIVRAHGIEIRASGSIPSGPALLVSNHTSYLDPIVIGSLLPCVPISKLDVAGWPIVGPIARDLGVLFVSRGNGHSGMRVMRDAAGVLSDGMPVLNFPEGTTTAGATVLPFRWGLFGVASRAGVPVIPVSVRYEPPIAAWVGDESFLPHYLRLAAEEHLEAIVRFGAAVPYTDLTPAAELASRAEARVREMLGESNAAAIAG